ncbi:MAG: hypothetical protein OEV66_01110 [Spirochaetia bacterium]|nr:hypothetical protein [Spirochaetia bacterium]
MKWLKYIIIAAALPLFSALIAQTGNANQGQSNAQGSAQQNTAPGTTGGTTGSGTAATTDTTAAKPTTETNAWKNEDYKSYVKALDDLIKLDNNYAQGQLNLALSNYQVGKSLLIKMREAIERSTKESEETLRLNEKWYWQTMDRKNREEKKKSDEKRSAKLKAVTYFTKAVHQLDEIENVKIKESPDFKALLSNIYRDWAMAQYDLGNIPQIIDVLNRYLALDPKYETIAEPHKYLASAYAFQEKILEKYGAGSEHDLKYFKHEKNKHLARATEILYGKDSPEYSHIMDVINRDETIAITP